MIQIHYLRTINLYLDLADSSSNEKIIDPVRIIKNISRLQDDSSPDDNTCVGG